MSRISHKLRIAVIESAGNRCEYCRFPASAQPAVFPVDHIVPRSRGGQTVLANLALACPRCNGAKLDHVRALDPRTGRSVLLFNPRTQRWHQHFHWSRRNPAVLLGSTAVGRATIARLCMNHPEMVAARRILHSLGLLHESPI